jgi:signal transduction histidine kinase
LVDTCYIKFVLKIQDFGCGIPPDKLKNLFINFGNLEEHRQTNPAVQGLGLSICKSIIEQMGGSVEVESILGQGSSFNLTFKTMCGTKSQINMQNSNPKPIGGNYSLESWL